ncbi:MAG: site-specific integrase [Spirochaetales bacterium]|nr:site-specific integrase [Spirochaetales bacterium]
MELTKKATDGRFPAADLMRYHDSYERPIKQFVRFLDGEDVTMNTIRDYFRQLNGSSLSASTIRVRRQAVKDRVRRQFAYAPIEAREQIETAFKEMDRDPGLKCPTAQPKGVGKEKTIGDAEYIRLVDGCRSQRQRCFIMFLYTTGARVGELAKVELTDCRADGQVVKIRLKGKGSRRASYKEREVFILKSLYDSILETFGGSRYLFETGNGRPYSCTYVSGQIAKITEAVLGRRLSAHKLRHSFATKQVDRHGLTAVSHYLGHSDVNITARFYDHNDLSPADIFGAEGIA